MDYASKANIEIYHKLLEAIQSIDSVLSIGKSGGAELPENNESDIDLFVFCSRVPDLETRRASVEKMGPAVTKTTLSEASGRFWGVCDFVAIGDIDDIDDIGDIDSFGGIVICLMYFTVSEMDDEIESVLNGSRLDRESEYFYPTGRCATFASMHILCDKTGYIANMKCKLTEYPPQLAAQLFDRHIKGINDAEDFNRAVSRGDVPFYHFVLDMSIDHYLQALFALNKCWFPSRKRSLEYIDNFKQKPARCSERLLKTIALSAGADTLVESYTIWSALCAELTALM